MGRKFKITIVDASGDVVDLLNIVFDAVSDWEFAAKIKQSAEKGKFLRVENHVFNWDHIIRIRVTEME